MRLRIPISLFVVVLLSATLGQFASRGTSAGAQETVPAGKLVFATVRDGDFEIYSMAADGSDQRNLTEAPRIGDLDPTLSPGGTRVAFSRYLPGNPTAELFVMDADGGGKVRLTRDHGVANDREPAWSPSGKLIAFTRAVPVEGWSRIVVARADGTNRRRLTGTRPPAYDGSPAWSPAGDRIAFVSDRAGGYPEIWVMKPDGTRRTRLTWNRSIDAHPTWSPDGTRIAFERCCPQGTADIWVMNADGTGRARLTTGRGNETQPTWSTDGSTIAFVTYPAGGGNRDVHAISLDGRTETALTGGPTADVGPDWEPPVPPAAEPTPSIEPSPSGSPQASPSASPDATPSPTPEATSSPEETLSPSPEPSTPSGGGAQVGSIGGAVLSETRPTATRPRYRVLESRRILPGLRYQKILDRGGPNRIHVLRMSPLLRPTLDVALAGGDLTGPAPTSRMARAHRAVAAVNGDFGLYGRPVHPFAEDGDFHQTWFGYSHNVAMSYREDAAYFKHPTPLLAVLQTESGDVLRVDRWNRGEPTWGEVGGYTPAGALLERPPSFACSARLVPAGARRWTSGELGVIRDYVVDEAACRRRRLPPEGGVVVSAQPGSPEAVLIGSLTPGERVTWTWSFGWAGVADSLGGYPLLVQGGESVIRRCWASICARHPRTAVGVDRDGRMLLVVVDGRRPRSLGMDLGQLANLMRRLGAMSALNLDGGGSSTMVVRGRIVNRPSDGRERSVSSALLILDGADRGERIRDQATMETTRRYSVEQPPRAATPPRRGAVGDGVVGARASRVPALYDPGSTGGLLEAVNRGLFGGRGLPPALRALLGELRASGWSEVARYPARSTRRG